MAQSVALNGKLSTSNKQFIESARQEQIDLQKYLILCKIFLKVCNVDGLYWRRQNIQFSTWTLSLNRRQNKCSLSFFMFLVVDSVSMLFLCCCCCFFYVHLRHCICLISYTLFPLKMLVFLVWVLVSTVVWLSILEFGVYTFF